MTMQVLFDRQSWSPLMLARVPHVAATKGVSAVRQRRERLMTLISGP